MKRITDFIVKHRNIILAVFVALAGVSVVVSGQVKINHDMTEYLPDSSETRQGMDIMSEQFEEEDTSELTLMVSDLDAEAKQNTLNYLESLDSISEVEYDDSTDYNRDNKTLYKITVAGQADSETAAKVFAEINEHFEAAEQEFATGGAVTEQNKEVLPFWIVALAVGVALIILIIMSNSYVEPFLFLFTILIAILLNKGTNIIFPSVSNITDSITAILQLALSMDYSIMLMTRYNQEKLAEKDNVKAMKAALYNAFKSISSSSLTTIVGLLALVFMSFTIGRDLGFVLAKGVLFSLLAIFTCLPALILMFDKLIVKTHKKCPEVKFNKVGKVSYKLRYVGIGLFVLAFGVSFLMKGNLGILYTDSEEDAIGSAFEENNQMAIIYQNDQEEKLARLCQDQENKDKIKQVLCYGNTIGEDLTVENFNQQLVDLGTDTQIEEYLLGIIYYNYYAGAEDYRLTSAEFVDFIDDKVYSNEDLAQEVDAETRANLEKLKNFTSASGVTVPRAQDELASILNIDSEKLQDLLVYYNSRGISTRVNMTEFVNFLTNYVLDSKYGDNFDANARGSLTQVARFVNRDILLSSQNASQMANFFGISQADIESLYLYYTLLNNSDTRMTLAEFVEFVNVSVANNLTYAGQITPEAQAGLAKIAVLSNRQVILREMTSAELAEMFDLPEANVVQILGLKSQLEQKQIVTLAPVDFVQFVLAHSEKLGITGASLASLNQAAYIMDSAAQNLAYDYTGMSDILGMDAASVRNIYALYAVERVGVVMTPWEFTNFVLAHQGDAMLAGRLNQSTVESSIKLQRFMEGVVNYRDYSAPEMAGMLGVSTDDAELLYSLYEIESLQKNVTVSLRDFVDFMIGDVLQNPKYRDQVEIDFQRRLVAVQGIIRDTLNGRKYAATELMTTLSALTNDLDENLVKLLYLYHGSVYNFNYQWRMTVEELINYVHDDILQDVMFADFIDDEMRTEVNDAKEMILDAKQMLVGKDYSRVILNTTLAAEGEDTFNYVKSIKDQLAAIDGEHYMIGNSLMAYEMSQSFGGEMDYITILTMIFIFVVVAFTFKSLLIPAILVLLIQCAVYVTMGIMTVSGGSVYFIALLIVQSILMGATIDYAILYTSYYVESRETMNVKEAIINSYNKSIHAIATSGLILILATLIVGSCSSGITAKICNTISEGTTCAALLILILLPAVLGAVDRLVIRKKVEA